MSDTNNQSGSIIDKLKIGYLIRYNYLLCAITELKPETNQIEIIFCEGTNKGNRKWIDCSNSNIIYYDEPKSKEDIEDIIYNRVPGKLETTNVIIM